MRYLATILLLGFCACQSAEEKFIQAEFDKVQGSWVMQSFKATEQVPDSLKVSVKTGELLFYNCEYNKKRFSACGVDMSLNNIIFGASYGYDYSNTIFQLSGLGLSGDNIPLAVSRESKKMNLIFRGDWQIDVLGNTMTAKQIGNFNKIPGTFSFTATRK